MHKCSNGAIGAPDFVQNDTLGLFRFLEILLHKLTKVIGLEGRLAGWIPSPHKWSRGE